MQIISKSPLIAKKYFEIIQKRCFTVRKLKGKLVCNCPYFSRTGEDCAHIREVAAQLNIDELDK